MKLNMNTLYWYPSKKVVFGFRDKNYHHNTNEALNKYASSSTHKTCEWHMNEFECTLLTQETLKFENIRCFVWIIIIDKLVNAYCWMTRTFFLKKFVTYSSKVKCFSCFYENCLTFIFWKHVHLSSHNIYPLN